jgi:hypothetical protein
MIQGFDNAVLRLCDVGKEGRFLRVAPRLRPEVTISDRRLVAGELTAAEAQRVADADQAMATWEALYQAFIEERARIVPRSEGLDTAIAKASDARQALERVAELPRSGSVVCDTAGAFGWSYTITP